MHRWTALALALLLAAWPVAAADKHSTIASRPPAFSAVVLKETNLRDATGAVLARPRPYDVLLFIEPKGKDWLVRWQKQNGRDHQGLLSSNAAALVLGPPAKHTSRLGRIRKANLPPKIKSRLMAGRINEGDDMLRVEMAWGRPERSFMINYISDEQHFVYLTPGGKPVILRFVAGALEGPLPAHTRAAAAQVESPTHPR